MHNIYEFPNNTYNKLLYMTYRCIDIDANKVVLA